MSGRRAPYEPRGLNYRPSERELRELDKRTAVRRAKLDVARVIRKTAEDLDIGTQAEDWVKQCFISLAENIEADAKLTR